MLLVAVAAAFTRLPQAIEINDQFFRATQAGRIAVTQISTAVRRCQVASVGSYYDGHSASVSADTLNFESPDNKWYHYAYDPTAQTLTLTDEAAGKTVVLAHHIQRAAPPRSSPPTWRPTPPLT